MRKKQKQAERMNNFMNKYKATIENEKSNQQQQANADKYTFTPQDFKFENKHYKYIKYTKHDNKISKVSLKFLSIFLLLNSLAVVINANYLF